MVQFNWIVTAKLQGDSVPNDCSDFYNYVDNWLFVSCVSRKVLESLRIVEGFAPKAGFVISPWENLVGEH